MSAASLGIVRVAGAEGPTWLLRSGDGYHALDLGLAALLRLPVAQSRALLETAATEPAVELETARILPPIEAGQEVWATGVTYARSRDGRIEEATDGGPYDRVYVAHRPELFFKSTASRVVGPGDAVGIRADSDWNVPEAELTLVVTAGGELFGYTAGNDMSSRSIEGENLLYLPQAKVYTAGCALGPEIIPAWASPEGPLPVALTIERSGATVFSGATSTGQMVRTPAELIDWLTVALEFPDGAFLLTGTGIVPEADFTLQPDDLVTVAIDGIGTLRNPVASIGRLPTTTRSDA